MKTAHSVLIPTAFALTLGLSQSLAASVDDTQKSAGIPEAIELYVQAVPMDINSLKRAQLLGKAEKILQKVIERDPGSLEAHRKLLGIYLQKQDYTNGIKTMQSAINLSPEDPKLFISLAILYQKSGALELAEAMLDQALALDPNQELAREYKVVIKKKLEMEEKAMNDAAAIHQPPH